MGASSNKIPEKENNLEKSNNDSFSAKQKYDESEDKENLNIYSREGGLKEKIVIWIDQNNDKTENNGYLKIFSQELKEFSFILVTSVKEGYMELSKFSFKLIYIILSGRIAEEFLDIYEENLQDLNIASLNIIFCSNGKLHESKKYANDPFYNPGGVVTDFKDVIKFLKKDRRYPINKQKYSLQNDFTDPRPFIFIENKIENIALPTILTKFSSRFINEEEFEKFKQFLINNYTDDFKGYDILRNKIKIPFYLYTKLFLRLYSSDFEFYRDLNHSLMTDKFTDFKQFIFILFYGLNLKIIKSVHDIYLYRSGFIDKQTYEEILNSLKADKDNEVEVDEAITMSTKRREVREPRRIHQTNRTLLEEEFDNKKNNAFMEKESNKKMNNIFIEEESNKKRNNIKIEEEIDKESFNIFGASKILLTHSFLSFSKNQEVATTFLEHFIKNSKLGNKNTKKPILFIVNPLKEKIDLNVTNFNENKMSCFDEEEVIFLPFLGFEICALEEKGEYYRKKSDFYI